MLCAQRIILVSRLTVKNAFTASSTMPARCCSQSFSFFNYKFSVLCQVALVEHGIRNAQSAKLFLDISDAEPTAQRIQLFKHVC